MTQSLRAGARGYLVKDAAVSEVVHAIDAVQRGEDLRAAELLGAHATLSKPLNSSLLRLTLQQVLTA